MLFPVVGCLSLHLGFGGFLGFWWEERWGFFSFVLYSDIMQAETKKEQK